MNNERTYSGISLTQRAAARRDRFIDAGIELFGTIGYNATTVRKLNAVAELSNRYFYESFEGMEELLIACYERLIRDFRDKLQHSLVDVDDELERKIHRGLMCFFAAMSDPKFVRITHGEILGISQRVDEMYHSHMANFAKLLVAHFQDSKHVASHSFQKELIGAALIGAVTHAGMVWVRSGYEQPIEVVVGAIQKVFMGASSQLI